MTVERLAFQPILYLFFVYEYCFYGFAAAIDDHHSQRERGTPISTGQVIQQVCKANYYFHLQQFLRQP